MKPPTLRTDRERVLPGHLFHPSAEGHDLIGRRLTRVILDKELVEGSGAGAPSD